MCEVFEKIITGTFCLLFVLLVNPQTCYGLSSNQQGVLDQLNSITNPTPSQTQILNSFASLSSHKQDRALNQMAGLQYSSQFLAAQIANKQFIRRLYDPLRAIISYEDFSDRTDFSRYAYGFYDAVCPVEYCGLDVWIEGGRSYSSILSHKKATGFKMNGNEILGGAQYTFDNDITFGIAGSYSRDYLRYHVGGRAKNRTSLGSIYALYRPDCYYILADAVFGYSSNVIKRDIDIGSLSFTAHSQPNVCESTFYTEVGKDFFWKWLFIQPFAGVDIGYARSDRINEWDTHSLNLIIEKKHQFNADSRLGVHLTSARLPQHFVLYVDLAWLCRLSNFNTRTTNHFEDFGSSFGIKGTDYTRNSLEGIINLSTTIGDNWTLFAEVAGERWIDAGVYSFLGGAETSW